MERAGIGIDAAKDRLDTRRRTTVEGPGRQFAARRSSPLRKGAANTARQRPASAREHGGMTDTCRRRALAGPSIAALVLLSAIAGPALAGQPAAPAIGGPGSAPVRASSPTDRAAAGQAGRKAPRQSLPPGSTFRDCGICPEMVVVPAGSFVMGSPPDEKGRLYWESPPHRVTVARSFAVGKYEVTFAEWDACVAANGCGGHRPFDWYWGRGRLPVINVSWEDAKAYLRWLSQRTSKPYRLLSEAEWEYAARAGTAGPYHFGSAISTDRANYNGSRWGRPSKPTENRRKTVPVGSFPPNAFGLHDMHGNVWEWVEDCWNLDYRGAPTDGSAWIAGGICRARPVRGGAWCFGAGWVRSAARLSLRLHNRGHANGIRVARDLGP